MKRKPQSLLHRNMMQFAACIIVILILAAPVFYWLTKSFYAEDMIKIIETVQQGQPIPELDLEEDIIQGIMIQYLFISVVIGIAIVLVNRIISRRLWRPFDETLRQIERFRLEEGTVPALPESRIKEFTRLNHTLIRLMENSLTSYRTQKEFIENASHELQTPLAVFRSKLDLLLQQPELTRSQADAIGELYRVTNRLTQLNKSLLLLARIENNQYSQQEEIDVIAVLKETLPPLESLIGDLKLHTEIQNRTLSIEGNKILLESLINNLIVNAVRHNTPDGEIVLTVKGGSLTVSNSSDGKALDSRQLFHRFYRPSEQVQGNGLGLSIVKAICDYHGWHIDYEHNNGMHRFQVDFHTA